MDVTPMVDTRGGRYYHQPYNNGGSHMKTVVVLVSFSLLVLALALVSVTPAPVSAVQAVEHTALSGDDLHLLAAYYYRDPRRWKDIWQVNRKAVQAASVVPVGTVLVIPGQGLNPFPVPYADWRAQVAR
jgi:hypothetical protein